MKARDVRRVIKDRAAALPEAPACYWFSMDFDDPSEDFCRGCIMASVDERYAADPLRFKGLGGAEKRYQWAIDGGFSGEHDALPTCSRCGARLAGDFTRYGADEEIAALNVHVLDEADGWRSLSKAVAHLRDDDSRWGRIAKIVVEAMGKTR